MLCVRERESSKYETVRIAAARSRKAGAAEREKSK